VEICPLRLGFALGLKYRNAMIEGGGMESVRGHLLALVALGFLGRLGVDGHPRTLHVRVATMTSASLARTGAR
jgi:hypothetical protein